MTEQTPRDALEKWRERAMFEDEVCPALHSKLYGLELWHALERALARIAELEQFVLDITLPPEGTLLTSADVFGESETCGATGLLPPIVTCPCESADICDAEAGSGPKEQGYRASCGCMPLKSDAPSAEEVLRGSERLSDLGRMALAAKKVIVGLEYVPDFDSASVECPMCFALSGEPHNCAWGKLVAKMKEVQP